MPTQTEKERFRSFAERYVIERAGHWKPGEEDTGAWAAVQDAKRVYQQIATAGDQVQDAFNETALRIAEAQQATRRVTGGVTQGPPSGGAGAAYPYGGPYKASPPENQKGLNQAALKAMHDPNTPPGVAARLKDWIVHATTTQDRS